MGQDIQSLMRQKRQVKILAPMNSIHIELIKRKVYQFWFDHEFPTFDKILQVVNQDEGLPYFSRTSLYRLLKSLNFEYMKQGRNRAMVEKTKIVRLRKTYLKQIRQYRKKGQPIYYLTESCTVSSERFLHFFHCHIGSEDGFVPGSPFSFEPNQNTHENTYTQMDCEHFRGWLESVLPKLQDHAVIVMDYFWPYTVKRDNFPTINSRKPNIIEWLEAKGEVVDTSMTIPELLKIVNRLMPKYDRNIIEKMVKDHKKYVLRLPPNHEKINLINLALSSVKNYMKMNKKTSNLRLIDGVDKVNPDIWKSYIQHVIEEENKLWNMDYVIDELMPEREPCVLDVASDDLGLE